MFNKDTVVITWKFWSLVRLGSVHKNVKHVWRNVLQNRCSQRFHKIHTTTAVLEPRLKRLYQKEAPAQVFSYKFYETFRTAFFTEYLGTTASEFFQNQPVTGVLKNNCFEKPFWTLFSLTSVVEMSFSHVFLSKTCSIFTT